MSEYTLEEVKKATNNFDEKDFWYWFLSPNKIDLDTKVHVLEHTTIFGDLISYMRELKVIEGEER